MTPDSTALSTFRKALVSGASPTRLLTRESLQPKFTLARTALPPSAASALGPNTPCQKPFCSGVLAVPQRSSIESGVSKRSEHA